MSETSPNLRELLTGIGIGHFNATMVIPYMMISPATTDPKASQVILIVQHLQRALYRMGATDVPDSGVLDAPTAAALYQVVGPNWERMPWSASVAAVLAALRGNAPIRPTTVAMSPAPPPAPVAIGGPLDFLPDVPGGIVTYAAVGYLLYRHFSRARRTP